jgi:hypothetical protein
MALGLKPNTDHPFGVKHVLVTLTNLQSLKYTSEDTVSSLKQVDWHFD